MAPKQLLPQLMQHAIVGFRWHVQSDQPAIAEDLQLELTKRISAQIVANRVSWHSVHTQ
jgi:hypothetical protein